MTQEDIAQELCMSRSSVSRLLAKSIGEGIVQITINDTGTLHPNVARQLSSKFGLLDVIIVSTHAESSRTFKEIGDATAAFLSNSLKNGMLLGITRGKSNFYTSRSIHNMQGMKIDTVQMMGCTSNTSPRIDSYALTEEFAKHLNGTPYVMPVPLMTKSHFLCEQLLEELLCKTVVDKYDDIDIALVEVNTLSVKLSSQFRDSWLSKADALQLSEVGAVASVCGHYFDKKGLPCNAGINERIIATSFRQLKKIPMVIGTAISSNNMVEAVISILRSKLLHVLIIDESLAYDLESSIAKVADNR